MKINYDNIVLRHVIFIIAEIKACIFEKEYFTYKNNRFFSRFYLRLVKPYFLSFMYSAKKKCNFKINNNFLNKDGYKILKGKIELSDLDFIQKKENKDNKQIISPYIITNIDKAENFAIKQGFHAIVKQIIKKNKCMFNVVGWDTIPFTDYDAVKTTQWHRDRDGHEVIKFFIHLSDVDENSGPHEYAVGSHIHKPIKYVPQVRYRDLFIKRDFKTIKITGSRGTCFVADTTGLHRGTQPISQKRSILQFAYYTGPIFWHKEVREVKLD